MCRNRLGKKLGVLLGQLRHAERACYKKDRFAVPMASLSCSSTMYTDYGSSYGLQDVLRQISAMILQCVVRETLISSSASNAKLNGDSSVSALRDRFLGYLCGKKRRCLCSFSTQRRNRREGYVMLSECNHRANHSFTALIPAPMASDMGRP